jgi:V8-like Glu-specific endopeptidase
MDAKSAHFFSSKTGETNHSPAIVPLISENKKTGEGFFIGTAFYISSSGLLMTAKHNLFDKKNLHFDNLGVIHFLPNNAYILRPIRKITYSHEFDIAYLLPEAILHKGKDVVTNPCLTLTDSVPEFDDQLGMYGFPNTKTVDADGEFQFHFNPEFYLGKCREYHKDGFSLLRNPCYQTSINIKSGASGGPVFDKNGHVFAVCSTGIDLGDGGENISFVTPIIPSFSLVLEDGAGNKLSISQLIEKKVVGFKNSAK